MPRGTRTRSGELPAAGASSSDTQLGYIGQDGIRAGIPLPDANSNGALRRPPPAHQAQPRTSGGTIPALGPQFAPVTVPTRDGARGHAPPLPTVKATLDKMDYDQGIESKDQVHSKNLDLKKPQKAVRDLGKRRPLTTHFSFVAWLILMAYLGATGWYLYVRIMFSLDMGGQTWYGIYILVVECMGISAMLPYAALLVVYTLSSGSKGLPKDDGQTIATKSFHVRVLIPCYKEGLQVVMSTVGAALEADLPPGTQRTIYLCDDGKDPEKAAFIGKLGSKAVYVSGRTRAPGEINGKSANLNNCLQNVIYKEYLGKVDTIPTSEVVVVFDADMNAKPEFFLKVLEVMYDDDISLTLTPQAFSNINPNVDIFNNINQQFWEYVLPGCDAWGYIACTGTNFCLRAKSLAKVKWFPEWTITEDYALSMELKKAGCKGRYLADYLAVGEAPDEIRNVFRQRSRWTKGHMQVFFGSKCPMFSWHLSLPHKILYTYGTWSYFATIMTTYTFLMVPFVSLFFGYHPVAYSSRFALAATLYLAATFLVMNYVRKLAHLKGNWFATVSNYILCFTYFKAVVNTLLSKLGFKEKAGFKSTDKRGGQQQGSFLKLMNNLKRSGSRPTSRSNSGTTQGHHHHQDGPVLPTHVTQTSAKTQALHRGNDDGGCCPNVGDLQGILDPLVLALMLGICLSAIAVGFYQLFVTGNITGIYQLVTTGQIEVYTTLPMLWAGYNAIPAILFFIYWFNKGPFLEKICVLLQIIGTLLACGAVACLWFALPAEYDYQNIMPKTLTYMDVQRSGPLMSSTKSASPWLEESGLRDRVLGGWYMTGSDYVKYSHPMAVSVSFMAWSLLEFKSGYGKVGQYDRMLDNIRWGADYLMACHIEEYQFIAQIGNAGDYYINPDAGTGFWGKPSDMPKNRTVTRITLASDGGADAVAAASAALSSTAMVFSSIDRAYAEQALNHAAKLYDFALKMQPVNASYCKVAQCFELSESELKQKVLDDGTNVTKVTEDGRYVKWNAFNSTSQFDDVAWAAAWLYRASRKSSFANDAEFYLRQHWQYEFKWYRKEHWASNWDNVGWATSMMLASELQSDFYRRNVTSFLRGWIRGNVEVSGAEDKAYPITFTKKGLAWQADTPLPNVAMTAMMGLIWAKQPNNGYDSRINQNIKCWSWGQINYMLGGLMGRDNSFIVNYGKNPPSQPQHMQASCPGNDVCSVRSAFLPARANPNQLTGALVAGPTANDNYDDVRSSPQSKVGVHFNVPLNGAMAGVMELDLKLTDCQNGRGFYQSFFQPYSP